MNTTAASSPRRYSVPTGAAALAEILPVMLTGPDRGVVVLDAPTRAVLASWRAIRGSAATSAAVRIALDDLAAAESRRVGS